MNDLRYTVRALLKSRGFTTAAVVTLALGIGANVTAFSFINILLLKPPPVREPDRLVWISGASLGPTRTPPDMTYPDLQELAGAHNTLAGVAAFSGFRAALRSGSSATIVSAQLVTGNFFDLLGVGTLRGRAVTTGDEGSAAPVAVISAALWRRGFEGRDDVIGRTIELNGVSVAIVGVAAQRFVGADVLNPADIWVPLSLARQISSVREPYARTAWWLRAIGRLAPGVGERQAQAALAGVAASIAARYPDSHKDFTVALDAIGGATPGDRRSLGVLGALPVVPFAVLLIACANVASLLLARGMARTRELAVRAALGANRFQLGRLVFAESLVLAAASGAASILISLWAPELLLRIAGGEIAGDFSPDRRVFLFTFAICLLTALASAAIPALRLCVSDAPALVPPGAREPGTRPARVQRILVAGQLAVSLVLLTAAGLFLQSLAAAGKSDVGVATAGRVTLSFDLEMQRYSDDRARGFVQNLMSRTLALPGADSATYAAFVPLGDRVMFMPFFPDGATDPDSAPRTAVNMVGPRYFETLQLPILRGRPIDRVDVDREPAVVVVNQTMAARIAPDGDALGRRVRIGAPNSAPLEVVGIAGDVLLDEFGEAPRPMAYLPHDGRAGEIAMVASSGLSPAAAVRQLEDAVHALDGSVAVFHAMSLQQQLAARSDSERALSRLLAAAGGLALGLAAFGLYAVMSYAVTRRTREIGVRMAIGAQPRDIVRLFLREGMGIAVTGVAAGVPLALALTALMASTLFGVGLASPVGMLIALAPLLAAAAAAAYFPARVALRVDPVTSLRSE